LEAEVGIGPFPETPEGQRDYLDELTRIVLQTPDERCIGIFWWEPAVARGGLVARGFFDENGNSLPALAVFDEYTRPVPRVAK
jgi:arabinogalactan endo-1,4-beta-galactosidase